jgi:hypothetical protein
VIYISDSISLVKLNTVQYYCLWEHHVHLLLQIRLVQSNISIEQVLYLYELNKSHIISTDEDPDLWIKSFAVINLRGVSTNNSIIC